MTQYPQQPQPQYGEPAKKKHTLRNVLIVFGVLAVLGIGGCAAIVAAIGGEVDESHTVVYKVAGTSKAASLTYSTDGSTTMEQLQGEKLPWSKTLQIKGLIPVYQVSAQNEIGQTGTVTCTIEVDGKPVKTATSKGAGAIASCDHTP